MPTIVNVDIRELSGEETGIDYAKAVVDFWPFRKAHIEDGGEDYLLSANILRVRVPDGETTVVLPPTPAGNAMWVQERSFKGASKYLVSIPDQSEVNLWDLPHLDPATLDPETPLSPAWLEGLEAATEAAASAEAAAASAESAADAATAGLASKANQADLVSGLATKADQSALSAEATARANADALKADAATTTAALATKTDTTALGREALALVANDRLTPWYAALANRNNKRANVVVLGASLVEGAFVSSQSRTVTQSLAAGLRGKFKALGIGDGGGRGFIGVPSTELTTSGQYVPGMWPMTFTGGLLDPPTNGAASAFDLGAKHMLWYSNTPGNKVVHTLAAPVTSFDIHHVRGASGAAFTGYYKIDGGSAVVFSTNNATAVHTVLNVALPATSTIEVGVNGAGYLLFTGITEYAGDEAKGIQVHNCGHSGMKIAAWQDGYATAGSWRSAVASLTPDLLVLQDLGINDGATPMTLASIKTQLIAFIAVLRGGGITCPIILAANFNPKGGISLPWEWADYVTMLREIETADTTCVVVDHSQRVPSTVGTDIYGLFSTFDHLHARPIGTVNQWMADNYLTAISPR